MRIAGLALERYGGFIGRALRFRADAALHVVLGANESGKTTALSAIGDLLFGFGHRTDYAFDHDAKMLRIGGECRLASGETLVFRRRKGSRNTLVDGNDQPLPDTLLAPVLGNVTREMFSSEFGLTAAELRRGGEELLKAGGRLAETLAAGSAGLTALSHLREKLNLEAEALFTPRKSSGKLFYLAAERHDAAERRLRDAIVTADALQAAEAAVAAADQNHATCTGAHTQAGRDLARLQRHVRTRPKLARLEVLGLELAGFSDLPKLPGQMVANWRVALITDTDIAAELSRLAGDDAADVSAIAGLTINEALLASGTDIDAARERIGAVRKASEDLPRRQEAQRAAGDALDDAARRLGFATHQSLFEKLPADPALARVRELVGLGKRAAERCGEAELQRDKVQQECARLAVEDEHKAHAADPGIFRQRLEALSHVPADADRLRHELAACAVEAQSLAEAVAALNPAVPNAEALAALPLPDLAGIGQHVEIARQDADEERSVQKDIAAADQAISTSELELARLKRGGASATKAELQISRAQRDAGFERLRAALDGDAAQRHECLAQTEALIRAVDDVADALLGDAERAARREAAEERLAEAQRHSAQLATTCARLEAQRLTHAAVWQELWAASGLAPRPPSAMIQWREQVASILMRRALALERRGKTAALAASLEACRAALAQLLQDHGRRPETTLPADLIHREASIQLSGLQGAWTQARERDVARQRAVRDVAEAEAALAKARDAGGAHAAIWPAAVTAIGLPAQASLVEAETALDIWRGVAAPKVSFEREGRSVEGIESDIAAFAADVAALVSRAAADITGSSAQAALEILTRRLGETRRAADARARLHQAIAERKSARAATGAQRQAVAVTLAEARRVLTLDDAAELALVLDRLEQRQGLAAELARLSDDLAGICDGIDERALRAEQEGIDPDLLPGEIERLTLHQGQLMREIDDASNRRYQATRDRDTLAQGRDASGAARERAEAAADVLGVAERWLVRAAAVRLASRAIERHRAAVQDPLITRAGEFFSLATAGAFAGLGADFDDADRPVLVALRAGGARVAVAGLSEGTRDQLFLALRLALLDRRTAEPLPFIGDDLLASFDEPRTLRTLELLANFGRNRQVILFTHHRHVADLAGTVTGHVVDIVHL